MDIYTILSTIFKYSLLALGGIAILIPLYAAGFLIYKKVFHGTKKLKIGQWIALVLLSGWLLLVLGLTTFSRGANFGGSINLSLFSGYVNAWHEWSYTELQLIIFNMLMFAPLGFLLPFLTKRGEKFPFVCLISFLVTFFIEVLQLVTGHGIFELDDLLHNFAGSLFGYFVVMFFLACFRDKKWEWKPFMKMAALPLLYAIGICCAVLVYQNQEYGNLPIIPAEKQNMSVISVERETDLSAQTEEVGVYKNPRANDKQYSKTISQAVGKLMGIEFKSATYSEGNNKIFVGKASGEQLTVFTDSGEWTYTTWAENKKTLTEQEISAKKIELESWLNEYGLLPEGSVFTVQDYVQDYTTLRWDAPASDETDPQENFFSGSIMVEFDTEGAVSMFHYFIIPNEYVKNVEIISEEAAYSELMDGNFEQYPPFEKGDKIVIQDCVLSYTYDTKGFFRPAYRFSGYINETDYSWETNINAMK